MSRRKAKGRKGVHILGEDDPIRGLRPVEVSEEDRANGMLAVFVSSRYVVGIKDFIPEPGTKHMIVHRSDDGEVTFREAQAIKNEILHPDSDMVQVYPGAWRTIEMDDWQYFARPPGKPFPYGMVLPGMRPPTPDVPTIDLSDLSVYVVRGEVVEVFESEEHARSMYAEAGTEFPGGGVERLGDGVPHEDDGAAWTPEAKAKLAQLQAKLAQLQAVSQDMGDEGLDVDGPSNHNTDAEDAWGCADGPRTVEDQVIMPEMIEAGLRARERAREQAQEAQANDVVDDGGEDDAAAREDLAEMRASLVRGDGFERN